uniref:FAM91A1-like protein n=2 Tax=Zea mays TaxID=4577 RepID=A0A804Q268_MAIZE
MQQQMAATVEEQMMVKAIREESSWEVLPKRIQAALVSKEEWHRRVVNYCIRKRLPWSSCFARKVCKEGDYYEDLMRYLRKNLALYPYHLADFICRVMRISPFRYYCDVLFEAMKNEQPYDSIPNFSAADALRITGVGRNEFIDIMNKCRSKKIMWKLNKSIAKELLPAEPADLAIEPWWGVRFVNFTLEEFKLSEDETSAIDKICKEEVNSYVLFDPEVVRGLYRRGMVYFDVPVYPDDRFRVSRLEGFVSNKDQSYEDPIEELLYAVFVVSSENATVAELATTLQVDLYQLQAAASFACRLGWAVKLLDTDSVLRDSSTPALSNNILSDEVESSRTSVASEKSGHELLSSDSDGHKNSGMAYVGFIVDANVTSYLMMGSLSPGLKSHAVTLYEAGKLGDSCIADLCNDLASLEGKRFEGVLQEFANHAFSLRSFLECLLSGGTSTETADLTTSEANNQESSVQDGLDTTCAKENKGNDGVDNAAENSTQISESSDGGQLSLQDNKMGDSDAADANRSSASSTIVSEGKESILKHDCDSVQAPKLGASAANGPSSKSKRSYRVNILRCESLASLAPSTLERLLARDYDIVVSMIPLPSSSVLPCPSGLVHFGPPSYSSMTPWMKLALYTSGTCGPVSAVFMKGQRLRLLPEPLASCEKALIWSWDQSVVGGLGGKFEGNLVKGSLLLHYLNSMTKHSAVVVQPLSEHDLDETGSIVTIDVPLPLKNADGSIPSTVVGTDLPEDQVSSLILLLEDLSNRVELSTVGYLRLLRLHRANESSEHGSFEWVPLTIEFGIPLFSPQLCERICERVVESQMLQKDDIAEHYETMQNVRRRLRELCTEYQATGPTARLFNQRGGSKNNSPRKLVQIVSGRWSPFHDPSTPTHSSSPPAEHERAKPARRQRCFTEVLSFDGRILRSYALTPVYEAATRSVSEEQPTTPAAKPDHEDANTKDVALPGVNLIFDGTELHPFDIVACLQARQPLSLIAEASATSLAMK